MSEVRTGMVIAGKYRLDAVLARGGMGSVWRAHHLGLDTDVAVKFIGAEVFALQEARKRFEREARAAALLQSPNVVQVHDYGVEGNIPYLVMELLIGEDLGARLKRKVRLSPAETTNIVIQVARALRRAAEASIVHRDLKPSNVFILRGDDDEALVKVLDFGIAKTPGLIAGDDTKTGAIIGSPRYMSPEQARGSRLVDPRSDLWSLAVIAYRALTGVLPFQSTEMTDLIVKICSETAPPPSELEPSLPAEMDAFFERAFQRDPGARFQTARELAAAFAAAAGEPPPSLSSTFLLRPRASQPSAPALLSPLPPPEKPPASGRATTPPITSQGEVSTHAAPSCEPTRISETPTTSPVMPRAHQESLTEAEPAASRRPVPLPEGTLTTYPPGTLDVAPRRAARSPPRRARLWRVAIGAAAAILLGGMLLLVPWGRSTPPPVVDAAIAVPEGTHTTSVAAPPPPPPPEPQPEPSAEPPAPSAGEPSVPRSHRAPAPVNRIVPQKKHPILGI